MTITPASTHCKLTQRVEGPIIKRGQEQFRAYAALLQLPYVVECKAFAPFYEPIAAFDCQRAAEAYRDECVLANKARPTPFVYQIVDYSKKDCSCGE